MNSKFAQDTDHSDGLIDEVLAFDADEAETGQFTDSRGELIVGSSSNRMSNQSSWKNYSNKKGERDRNVSELLLSRTAPSPAHHLITDVGDHENDLHGQLNGGDRYERQTDVRWERDREKREMREEIDWRERIRYENRNTDDDNRSKNRDGGREQQNRPLTEVVDVEDFNDSEIEAIYRRESPQPLPTATSGSSSDWVRAGRDRNDPTETERETIPASDPILLSQATIGPSSGSPLQQPVRKHTLKKPRPSPAPSTTSATMNAVASPAAIATTSRTILGSAARTVSKQATTSTTSSATSIKNVFRQANPMRVKENVTALVPRNKEDLNAMFVAVKTQGPALALAIVMKVSWAVNLLLLAMKIYALVTALSASDSNSDSGSSSDASNNGATSSGAFVTIMATNGDDDSESSSSSSSSLAMIIASFTDSLADLVVQAILSFAAFFIQSQPSTSSFSHSKKMRENDEERQDGVIEEETTSPLLLYPNGRMRMEGIAVIACALIMLFTMIESLRLSIEGLATQSVSNSSSSHITMKQFHRNVLLIRNNNSLLTTWISLCITCIIKLILWYSCLIVNYNKITKLIISDLLQVLIEDHWNDFLKTICILLSSITTALTEIYLIESIVTVFVTIWIFIRWCIMIRDQIRKVVGYTASEELQTKVNGILEEFNEKLPFIQNYRIFHSSSKFTIEIDISLSDLLSNSQGSANSLSKSHSSSVLSSTHQVVVNSHIDNNVPSVDLCATETGLDLLRDALLQIPNIERVLFLVTGT